MIIVSACLAGMWCRYDGKSCPDEEVISLVKSGKALPLCPEQLGGLPTPRLPAEIVGGDGHGVLEGTARVLDGVGSDVTDKFIRGAHEVARLAALIGAREAILKGESPSCGLGTIILQGNVVDGDGVTVALLKKHGITVKRRK